MVCRAKSLIAFSLFFMLALSQLDAISVAANSTVVSRPDVDVPENQVLIGFVNDSTGELVEFPYRNSTSHQEEISPVFVHVNDLFNGYFTIIGTYVIEDVKEEYLRQEFDLILPANVFRIAEWAFSDCSFQSIGFYDNPAIQYIDDYAFANSSIQHIEIPESIVHLGEGAFIGSSLSEVEIPSQLISLEPYSFAYCCNLNDVDLSNCDSISIGEACFIGSPVTNLALSSGVVMIGDWAFASFDLEDLTVTGGSRIYIGERAFWNRFIFDFPFETVLEIGDYGFAEACFFMNGPIELPVLERLGAYAFLSCTFAFINTDSYLFFQALTEMGEGVFYDAYGITEVDFRISPLEEIPPNAFRDSSLSDVSLPSGLKSIGYSAFGNCGNLTSISDFPIGVVSIGDFAFYNCGLYEVALREGLASIGVYAFANNNLTYISIPASVVAIAAHAFSNNDLSSVYFDGDCQNIYIDHEAFDLFYIEEGEVNIKDELSDGV